MEIELPKGWVETNLSFVGDVITGNTPSKKHEEYYGGNIPWVKPGDINTGIEIIDTVETLTKLGSEKSRMLPKGAVMVTCIGNLGNVAIAGKPLSTNQQINSIVFNDFVDSKYGYYWCNILKPWLVENSTSTTISMVNKRIFESAPIKLPPLSEQHRIVSKLDSLFAHLEKLKTRLDKISLLLKNFRQAVLTQAVTGKLTEEWRKGKDLEEWKEVLLNDICLSITDGDHQAPPKSPDGIPFLVISNVSKGFFDFDNVTRFVPIEYYNSLKETRVPRKGDVLYTVTGSYGIALLVNSDRKFCFQRHIAILKPDKSKLLSEFLVIALNSPSLLSQAHNVATGTAQKTIPLKGIRNYKFNVPTIEEQKEIVKRVESLFSKADKIEAKYKSLKSKIDTLPQAILAKAFKGELVEQLPGDGDAKELLEEIKKLKEESKPKKKATNKIKRYKTDENNLNIAAEAESKYRK